MKKIFFLTFFLLLILSSLIYATSQTDGLLSEIEEAILNDDLKLALEKTDELENLLNNMIYQVREKSGDSYDFRRVYWGMSKEQVKSTETEEIAFEQQNILSYKSTIISLDCLIGYIFTDNKLTRTKYLITEEHTNENSFISDFNTLKSALIEKYGEPATDEHYWLNDLYKDDYSDWGFAVSLGHHSYFATWETSNTRIYLGLMGDNYSIELGIEYVSIEFEDLEKKTIKNQNYNDL